MFQSKQTEPFVDKNQLVTSPKQMFTALELQPKRYFLHGVPYLQLCRATQFATLFVLFVCFPLQVRPDSQRNRGNTVSTRERWRKKSIVVCFASQSAPRGATGLFIQLLALECSRLLSAHTVRVATILSQRTAYIERRGIIPLSTDVGSRSSPEHLCPWLYTSMLQASPSYPHLESIS